MLQPVGGGCGFVHVSQDVVVVVYQEVVQPVGQGTTVETVVVIVYVVVIGAQVEDDPELQTDFEVVVGVVQVELVGVQTLDEELEEELHEEELVEVLIDEVVVFLRGPQPLP